MTEEKAKQSYDLSEWSISGSFTANGILYPATPFTPEDLVKTEAGDLPHFDLLLASYPRTGSSRLFEVCWLLLHDINIEKSMVTDAYTRCYFPEGKGVQFEEIERPRIAKTHVYFGSIEKAIAKGTKVVVGLRNPKDTLVSYYHFCRMNTSLGLFPGTFAEFMQVYKAGRIPYGDIFDHILSWWNQRHKDNFLFMFYEDLNKKPFDAIKKIAEFLGKDYSDKEIQTVVDFAEFSNLKEQPAWNFTAGQLSEIMNMEISPYMRKGVVGDWKNYFCDEDNEYIDGLCQTRAVPNELMFQFE